MAITVEELLKMNQELRATVGSLQEAVIRIRADDLHKGIQELRGTVGSLQQAVIRGGYDNPAAIAHAFDWTKQDTRDALALIRKLDQTVATLDSATERRGGGGRHDIALNAIRNMKARIIGGRIDGDSKISVGETKTYTLSAMTAYFGCDCTTGPEGSDDVSFSWFTRPIVPEDGATTEAGLVVVRPEKARPWRAEVVAERAGEVELHGRIAIAVRTDRDVRTECAANDVTLRITVTPPAKG